MNKLIFGLIFTAIFLTANYYPFIRGYQALPPIQWLKVVYAVVFWILSVSFVVSRFTGKESFFQVHALTTWIGTFWMVASLYFFLIVIAIDIVRVFNYFLHFFPSIGTPQYQLLKLSALLMLVLFVGGLILYGNYNARHAQVVKLKLNVDKSAGKYDKLRVAMASDIHLGTIVNKKSLRRLTEGINSYHPDIILLPGDILDDEISPILRNDIGSPLRDFVAPLGVWAVPGNHEHIGDFKKASQYLESLNIRLLVDSTVLIDSSFYLVGRDDKDANRFSGKKRSSLKQLMGGVDKKSPVILMDHQPFNLSEAESEGVDLQLSGHTHNGQFWPFNYITSRLFEMSWGYLKKGESHFYVTSGYGSWGPSIRIGNHPEFVIIDLDFVQKD